jgi:hypothetical protein
VELPYHSGTTTTILLPAPPLLGAKKIIPNVLPLRLFSPEVTTTKSWANFNFLSTLQPCSGQEIKNRNQD